MSETPDVETDVYCRYYYDGWVHLVPDVDGIRIFTNEMCEFLQRVPGTVYQNPYFVFHANHD